jgi:hypothetical protein
LKRANIHMTKELEELLNSTNQIRKTISQVLPQEAVDYIVNLIAKDNAHRKYIDNTTED